MDNRINKTLKYKEKDYAYCIYGPPIPIFITWKIHQNESKIPMHEKCIHTPEVKNII